MHAPLMALGVNQPAASDGGSWFGKDPVITPMAFIRCLAGGETASMASWQQQDAQEFFQLICARLSDQADAWQAQGDATDTATGADEMPMRGKVASTCLCSVCHQPVRCLPPRVNDVLVDGVVRMVASSRP